MRSSAHIIRFSMLENRERDKGPRICSILPKLHLAVMGLQRIDRSLPALTKCWSLVPSRREITSLWAHDIGCSSTQNL